MAGTAFDTSALTLGEYAVMSNDPLIQKITYSLYQTPSVLKDIPMITKKSLVMNGVRFVDNLPGVNWTQLNQPPVVTRGKPTPWQEQVYLLRNQFQVDKLLAEDENQIEDPLDTQVNAWMIAWAYDFNTKIIQNGHPGVASGTGVADGNAIVGLRYRLDNYASYGMQAEMLIDGAGIDISPSGLTQDTANNFIAFVQQILDYMNSQDGEDVAFYCNDSLKRRWEAAIRKLGGGAGFDTTKDAFDRSVSAYKNAKICDIGRRVDQTTRVILPTETIGGADGGTVYTSLYAVKYGKSTFCGWHYEPLKARNLGLDPTNGVAYNTVVDYAFGLTVPNNRAIARLFGIKTA